uniref:C39 family peptidase n=1 Tax=Streptococcus pluranimalium TaxID=82348 RepID=UPI003F68DF9F
MAHKVIASLAVATVSVATAGIVQADEVTSTPTTDVTTLETQPQAEVSQEAVAEAKATFDKAQEGVNHQEIVVKEAQNVKDQAQLAIGNATTAVSQAQELANQASPETITQAKEAVTEATQNLATAQKQLEETQAKANTTQEAVVSQQTIVNNHQTTVTDAQEAVSQAKEKVDLASQDIDMADSQDNLAKAEKEVTNKEKALETAENDLQEAQIADADLEKQITQAETTVNEKSLVLTKTQDLLKQLSEGLAKEQVGTSLANQTYYNQRDSAWSSVYGGNTFAATGCVPASLAMVYSELLNRGVTPTEVANWLYNNTSEFNKRFSGTSAKGIVAVTNHYGLASTQLGSESALVKGLEAGHYVVGAVQNNKFSPWGTGYSHEVVLRGYSNGNTYVYDPYNRANIGWYSIASLWAEQSHDKDDSALGAPFFKITTKKMLELEAQYQSVQTKVKTAQTAVIKAKETVNRLSAQALQTPQAKAKRDQAQIALTKAQAQYRKAQEALKLANQDLTSKEANLKEAKAELAVKENLLREAKATLVESQVKLDSLKANAQEAKQAVNQASQKLEEVKQVLVQKEERLSALEEAPEHLAKAQSRLSLAKEDLAQKTQVFEQAQVELETLKILASEAQTHYMTVLSAYEASLAKDHYTQLKTDYQKVLSDGGQMVPVVDETGKVTGIINGTSSHQVKTSTEVHSLASTAIANRPPVNHSYDALPETGEESSALGFVGFSLISLLGLVGLKRKA